MKKQIVVITNTHEIETDGKYCGINCPQAGNQRDCSLFYDYEYQSNQCEYDEEADKDLRLNPCLKAAPLRSKLTRHVVVDGKRSPE